VRKTNQKLLVIFDRLSNPANKCYKIKYCHGTVKSDLY